MDIVYEELYMINNAIISEGIEYILQHLCENITINDVASHCCMSVSRFSVVFKEQTGESVYSFIKRQKMEQSAFKLKLETERTITDIGEEYGYSSSNYSWAFRQYHKISPVQFRKKMRVSKEEQKKIISRIDKVVRVESKPDYHVVYERSIGNYNELKAYWCMFTEKYQKDIDEETLFFERTFDDPAITDKEHCIYDVCMTTKNILNYDNTCVLKGGKFLIYPFKGYISQILHVYQELLSIWFPTKKYELDERYSYDQYNIVREDGYMEFDICIPIK